jgi:hypothetical protein
VGDSYSNSREDGGGDDKERQNEGGGSVDSKGERERDALQVG